MNIGASKEDFLNLEYHRPDENEKFNGFVIIPTDLTSTEVYTLTWLRSSTGLLTV